MRIKGLDVLRGIAILLVIYRHGILESNPVKEFGWIGVDLFFVISGFLVSGIIFKEYLKSGTVNIKRFFMRRGFKIYPSFYFFMLFSIVFHWFHTQTFYDWHLVLAEAFYFQNYTDGIWYHTWSLDVEEHFYIVLALFALVAMRTKILFRRRTMVISLLLLLVISFILRFQASWPHRNEGPLFIVKTHLRSDGLIIGVLLSYIMLFTDGDKWIIGKEKIVFIAALILMIPGFCFKGGGFVMNTAGLTLTNIGFGLITAVSLKPLSIAPTLYKTIKTPVNILSYIGQNSYCIYLWHLSVLVAVNYVFNYSRPINFCMYLMLSLFIGILMTYVIEKPFLRWREKVSP